MGGPAAGPPSPRRATWRRRAAWAFVAAWLLWQVGLPLLRLAAPRPARFAWQMYSTSDLLQLFVVGADGGVRTASELSVMAVPRPEIRDAEALARALCAADPRAVAIRAVDRAGAPPRELPCR